MLAGFETPARLCDFEMGPERLGECVCGGGGGAEGRQSTQWYC